MPHIVVSYEAIRAWVDKFGSQIAKRRRAGIEKRFLAADWHVTNRCNPPGERKPCMHRARFRNGKWLFSARLFRPLWERCSSPGAISRLAAPKERSLAVTIRSGRPNRLISAFNRRFAARLSRLDYRISSRTNPSWSTAHQSQDFRPEIIATTSSRCQTSPGGTCRRRRFRAICGANFATQRRIVSQETSMPRFRRISSTSRKEGLKRTYSQTPCAMISGGKRWRLSLVIMLMRSNCAKSPTLPTGPCQCGNAHAERALA
ncbi:hypothetical protein SAMN05444959_1396 [Paracoccus seriniphilus]|uniref:Uncharacterized protein n=1 Tax=Paracoccus seriniphilus TaxID=184748 RepID=A0A239Q3M9_9RHOB|nr:hypothetical protein SAMN05444959_1396 [Paracoccus seriniphilus]